MSLEASFIRMVAHYPQDQCHDYFPYFSCGLYPRLQMQSCIFATWPFPHPFYCKIVLNTYGQLHVTLGHISSLGSVTFPCSSTQCTWTVSSHHPLAYITLLTHASRSGSAFLLLARICQVSITLVAHYLTLFSHLYVRLTFFCASLALLRSCLAFCLVCTAHFVTLFSRCYPQGVALVEMVQSKENPRENRGFAFIEFYNSQCA